MLFRIFYFFPLLVTFTLPGQTVNFEKFRLPNDIEIINCLFVDMGTIWAGTDEGLVKITNDSTKVFKYRDSEIFNVIYSIAKGPKDSIWCGNSSGYLFKLRKGVLEVVDSVLRIPQCEGGYISDLHYVGDKIWMQVGGQYILSFDPYTSQFQHEEITGKSKSDIYALYFDNRGSPWLCTSDGIYEYKKSKFRNTHQIYARQIVEVKGKFYTIGRDSEGRSVLRTKSTESNWSMTPLNKCFDSKSLLFRDICTDKTGNIWIATQNGIIKYQNKGKCQWINQKEYPQFGLKGISCIASLNDSSIIAGSWGNGLWIINYGSSPVTIQDSTLDTSKIICGTVFNIPYLQFKEGGNDYRYPEIAARNLNILVKYLKDHPQNDIILRGHALEEKRKNYSRSRTDIVHKFLCENGIDSSRIKRDPLGTEVTRHESEETLLEKHHKMRVDAIITCVPLKRQRRNELLASGWEVGVHLLDLFPKTDFDREVRYDELEHKPGIGISVSKSISNVISIQSKLLYGSLQSIYKGDYKEQFKSEPMNDQNLYPKNEYFKTKIFDYSFDLLINLTNLFYSPYANKKWDLKFIIGHGLIHFNTQRFDLNCDIKKSEGIFPGSSDTTTEAVNPIGFSLTTRFKSHFYLGYEFIVNRVNTDKLDAFCYPRDNCYCCFPRENCKNLKIISFSADYFVYNALTLKYKIPFRN